MIQREVVVNEAATWLGTPFHLNAHVKGAGVDCAWLLVMCYAAAGVPMPHELDIAQRNWHLHKDDERYITQISKWMHVVETPKLGDTVLFKIGRAYGHSAIVIQWPHVLVHVMEGDAVRVTDATQQPLAGKPYMFFSPWRGADVLA